MHKNLTAIKQDMAAEKKITTTIIQTCPPVLQKCLPLHSLVQQSLSSDSSGTQCESHQMSQLGIQQETNLFSYKQQQKRNVFREFSLLTGKRDDKEGEELQTFGPPFAGGRQKASLDRRSKKGITNSQLLVIFVSILLTVSMHPRPKLIGERSSQKKAFCSGPLPYS